MDAKPGTRHDSLVVFGPNATLFTQGEKTGVAYLVLEGSVELSCVQSDGSTLFTEVLGNGSMLCVVSAYFGTPLIFTGRSLNPTSVRKFPRKVLERIIEDQNLARLVLTEAWLASRALAGISDCYAELDALHQLAKKNVQRLTSENQRLSLENNRLQDIVRNANLDMVASGVPLAPLTNDASKAAIAADLSRALREVTTEPDPPTPPEMKRGRKLTIIGVATSHKGVPKAK